MAYKVLYRKYRPKTFSDVVGQHKITDTLKNELISNKIAHAYLFTGSRGTGKTTCAKILAKAVNCLNPQNGDPCLECANCVGIENGSIMDVLEIDAASNNRVDDVRTLIEEVAFTPANAKFRVYIIDEVHELSSSAFNALLKTLEEPPEHAIFILATTEVHKLLTTILSRCQRFDFRRITPDDIADRLEHICSLENATIEREAALMIARIADGGMRDAISILDQCIIRNNNVSIATVQETAGVIGKDHLFELAEAVNEQDGVKALNIINDLHENSKDLTRLCEELIEHFRHLMLIKTMGDKQSLIVMSDDEKRRLTDLATKMKLSAVIQSLETLQKTLDKMKFSIGRIEIEMAFVRLCNPSLDTSTDALLRRIEAIEQGRFAVSPIQKPTKSTQKQAPVNDAPNTPSLTEELSKNAVEFKDWQEVVHIIKDYSKTVGTAFSTSQAYLSGDYLLVDGSRIAFELLRTKPELKEQFKTALFNITGKNYKLGPYVKPKGVTDKGEPDSINMLIKRAEDAGIEVKTTE